jgi:hypothetical protein
MQTLEFTRALKEIVKELKVPELISIMQPWMNAGVQLVVDEATKGNFSTALLGSYAGVERLSQLEATGKILKGLGIHEMYSAPRLGKLLAAVSNLGNTQQLWGNPSVFPEFSSFYEQLKSLRGLQATSADLLEGEKVGQVEPSAAILELQLIDYDGKGIEPNRLSRVAVTLAGLYTNLARVLDVHDGKLTFKYFDSGSDVVMAIQGAKAVIDAMGPLLLQFWDKFRFRHHETFEKDLEALSKGLDFMAKVQEAVDKNVLSAEEANNLKTRVFRGVDELIGLGATLPLKDAAVDQRQLLIEKRDMKLLASGQPSEADDNPEEASSMVNSG